MSIDDSATLFKEKPEDVAFQLMADWWMNTFQALVDSAGSEGAQSLIRPYHKNAATAAAYTLIDALGITEKDNFGASFVQKNAMDFFTRSTAMSIDIKEFGSVVRTNVCPFRNAPIELCNTVCGTIPLHYIEVFNVPYDFKIMAQMSRGDPECVWVSTLKGKGLSQDPTELGETIANPRQLHFDQETTDSFSFQYLSEFWVMATRALIDHLDEDKATTILNPYSKHTGLSFGMKMGRSIDDHQTGNLLTNCFSSLYNALGMKGKMIQNEGTRASMIIDDCPFKDAPVCICSQISSFCNGVCEAIDPDFEFTYERMMTKGDGSCQWSVSRRDVKDVKGTKENDEKDEGNEALKALTMRFVQGEISEEELEKRMNALKRLGILK